jgi:predicted RNase H-like nuclease (RuvC/YqgF family)
MKRVFILLAISLSLAARGGLAQDALPTAPAPTAPASTTAAAIAAQQGAEERYKRMAADMQALQTDNESLKTRIGSLEQKIDDLRQQLAAAANNTNVQDDLKRLAEKIAEVDKKREEDKQAISDEIRKSIAGLEKTLAGGGASLHAPSPKLPPDTETAPTGNGFSYTIQAGDNLSAILKAYNADFKSKGWKTISLKQAKEANPSIEDWDRLRVGQKIIIPRPDGQ